MLFFYQLRFLSYILANIKNLIIKVFLLGIYFYVCGVVLLFLSNGLDSEVQLSSVKHVLSYLYKYVKLCYYNWDNLSLSLVIRLVVSLMFPYFIYKMFFSIKWKHLFKRLIIRIIAIIRKRRGKSLDENQNQLNKEGKVNNNYQDKVNAIKNILMHDIEKTIDKRLYDIFIAKRHPEDKTINDKVE